MAAERRNRDRREISGVWTYSPAAPMATEPVLGREQEIADLLRFMKNNGIRNTVWLTADVHYAAAHHHDPNRAQWDPGLQASAFPPGAQHP